MANTKTRKGHHLKTKSAHGEVKVYNINDLPQEEQSRILNLVDRNRDKKAPYSIPIKHRGGGTYGEGA